MLAEVLRDRDGAQSTFKTSFSLLNFDILQAAALKTVFERSTLNWKYNFIHEIN